MLNNKYIADVISHDYYFPFACQSLRLGMLLLKRHESSNEYRYGFNGMEKDDNNKNKHGSLTNAYRHALISAMLTKNLRTEVTKMAPGEIKLIPEIQNTNYAGSSDTTYG